MNIRDVTKLTENIDAVLKAQKNVAVIKNAQVRAAFWQIAGGIVVLASIFSIIADFWFTFYLDRADPSPGRIIVWLLAFVLGTIIFQSGDIRRDLARES